jgi:ABC-2 type transport system ATP-binding protein
MPAVEVNHFVKSFADRVAVRDLSFSVSQKEIGLIGPNGAGKTITIRILLSLLQANTGNLAIVGRIINRSETSEHIGSWK